MLHAAKDSLALPEKIQTKKFSQRQEVTKVHWKENFSLYLWKRGPLGIGKTTFLLSNSRKNMPWRCSAYVKLRKTFLQIFLGEPQTSTVGHSKKLGYFIYLLCIFCQHHFLYRMCINGYFFFNKENRRVEKSPGVRQRYSELGYRDSSFFKLKFTYC